MEEWCNNNRGSVNAGSVKPYERKSRVDSAKPCWNMVFFCFIKLTNSKMREDLPDHFPRKNIFICCFTFLWRFLRYRYWKGCAVQFKKFKKWAESLFSTLEPRRHLSFLLFPNSHQILFYARTSPISSSKKIWPACMQIILKTIFEEILELLKHSARRGNGGCRWQWWWRRDRSMSLVFVTCTTGPGARTRTCHNQGQMIW